MPKSRISRIIALLALLTIALMLAIASPGELYDVGNDQGGGGGQPGIELVVHFGW